MKIPIKTSTETKIMAEGGKKLARILRKVLAKLEPGIKLSELDQIAEKLIEKEAGQPSFKMVPGYNWATCINLGSGVVHGVPGNYRVKNGDLISVDLGIFYQGFHADMARTVYVRNQKPRFKDQKSREKKEFLKAGKKTLRAAINTAKSGNRVGQISEAIEKELQKSKLYPVTSLSGHGVGRKLHEPPSIPCFLDRVIEKTPFLKSGMTIAIEVIYTQRKTGLKIDDDGWTVWTENKSWGGLFEDTVLVTPKGGEVLTKLGYDF